MTQQLTKQEIFDTVTNHLLTQKKKATDEWGNCRYITADGSRCAVGALVSEEEACRMDGHGSVQSCLDHRVLPERLAPHVDFLQKLQELHDMYPCDNWRSRLRDMAEKRGLSFNPPREPQ